MPNIYKGDIGFTGQQANLIDKNNIGADLNYSVSSGNLLLTNDRTGEMFSYEDEPDKLENASAGRLKVSEPALHCPTCASRMIAYVRGKRKISIPFCPIHGHDSLTQYSNLSCNAFRNDAVRHFDAETFEADGMEATDVSLMDGMAMPEGTGSIIGQATPETDFTPFSVSAEDDPDFDREKADRNKDGEISSWERTVGNAVAKNMREQKSAELTGSEYYPVGQGRILGAITGDSQFSPLGSNAEEFGAELTGSEYYPVGQGRILGAITGDSQFSPLGSNAEEDVKMHRRMKAKRRSQDRKQARRMKARKYKNMAMSAEYDSPFGERQTTDFGMVGSGNDFAQNRAEMMESVSGRNLWVTTAMLAVGFVAGIAFKDMRQDTTSE